MTGKKKWTYQVHGIVDIVINAIAALVLILLLLTVLGVIFWGGSPFTWMDETSATRGRNLRLLRNSLNLYYTYNDCFPMSLAELQAFTGEELPKDAEGYQNYLYAYYPAEKPQSFHLGITFEHKRATILKNDSDFDSWAAGYVDGFDGQDPVYDLHVSK